MKNWGCRIGTRGLSGTRSIGERIRVGLFDLDPKTRGVERRPSEIVGVARHVEHTGLDADETTKVRLERI